MASDALLSAAGVLDPEAEELVLVADAAQLTTVGRSVTPSPAQKSPAHWMAASWSSLLHFSSRQHEISEMKSLWAQMQPASVPQSPMPLVRKPVAH